MQLFPYQEEGVAFLTSRFHALLGDDMGLGKTIQVIASWDKLGVRSMMVICPSSVKYNWARQIAKWSDRRLVVFVVKDGSTEIPLRVNIIVVNYELLLRDKIFKQLVSRGQRVGYDAVVCDEAHYLKNRDAKRTKRVLGKDSFMHNARYKWMLTGSFLLNRPVESYPILSTLAPEVIAPHNSWEDFGKRYCGGYINDRGQENWGSSNTQELADRLKSFMLRRTKDEVLDQLPPKVESWIEIDVPIPCDLEDTPMSTVWKELGVAKAPKVAQHIEDMLADTDKVVVFCHHRDVIHILNERLQEHEPIIVYGGKNAEHKQGQVDRFINDPNCHVLLAQIVAGGTGIDGLQGVCNYVVFAELDWSPMILNQAIDRLRRIGQANTVFVHYLVVPGSMESIIMDSLDGKRVVIDTVLESDKEPQNMDTKQIQATMQTLSKSMEATLAAMEAMSSTMSLIHGLLSGQQTLPLQPNKPKGGKNAEKAAAAATAADDTPPPSAQTVDVMAQVVPQAPANPTPTVPPAAPTVSATPVGYSAAQIGDLATAFIQTFPDKEVGKNVIRTVLLPKYGAAKMAELKPEFYAGFASDMAGGSAPYLQPHTFDPLGGL